MDPLSDVLSLLKPRSYVSAGFDAGGDWSIQFASQQTFIKCYAVISGQAWLQVDGVPAPVLLKAGDSFVLPSGRPFKLASDLSLPSIEAGQIFPTARAGGIVTHNGGGGFFLVGSRFAVTGDHVAMLLTMLPAIVHLQNESDQAALRWSVERMMQELREQQPGGFLIAQHLAHMMLVQALRLQLTDVQKDQGGWFYALADKQLGAALTAVHADPARRWTIQDLAETAGMSRSAFAERFKEVIGASVMDYITRWRMLLAADRLAHSDDSISRISVALGYESESAFSSAFKRTMGCPPRQYHKRQAGALANGAAIGQP